MIRDPDLAGHVTVIKKVTQIKGQFPKKKTKDRYSEGPQIGRFRTERPGRDLGRHKHRCPDRIAQHLPSVRECDCDGEIAQREAPLNNQNILWLFVAVNDVAAVDIRERSAYLQKQVHRFGDGQLR
jgi:hypothetical protein